MLETAENLRRRYAIPRSEQDELALRSHERALARVGHEAAPHARVRRRGPRGAEQPRDLDSIAVVGHRAHEIEVTLARPLWPTLQHAVARDDGIRKDRGRDDDAGAGLAQTFGALGDERGHGGVIVG